MHFVKKGDSPYFFENEKQALLEDPAWDNLRCRRELRKHLIEEQNELCIYCERRINLSNSHIEHVFPQSVKPNLRFDYFNLVASCNGDQGLENEYHPEKIDSCGHRKGSDFNEALFLNPVVETQIENLLSYNKGSCAIIGRDSDDEKAIYTIELLHLNNVRLKNERGNARRSLQKVLKKRPDKKKLLHKLLSTKTRPFVSFLRFHYAEFL